MTDGPRISVVVPTVGRLATLRRVLDALDAQTASGQAFELILAADATVRDADDLDRVLAGRAYPARRVNATLPGASSARNAGWQAARATLLLFIDDDITPDPGLIAEHLLWHERHPAPEVGVLGHVRWASELEVTVFMRWLERGVQFNYPSIRGTETVWGNFWTANVSVKRELVRSAGGFDEQRLPYGYEDLDLALRMHRRDGFRLLYNRAAGAQHLHRMDLDFYKRRVARIADSERRFVALHPDFAPYFYNVFTDAAARRPAAGHAIRLARFVPPSLPLLGRLVWSRTDLYYRQALAPYFLAAWDQARPASSGGSPPGGPK